MKLTTFDNWCSISLPYWTFKNLVALRLVHLWVKILCVRFVYESKDRATRFLKVYWGELIIHQKSKTAIFFSFYPRIANWFFRKSCHRNWSYLTKINWSIHILPEIANTKEGPYRKLMDQYQEYKNNRIGGQSSKSPRLPRNWLFLAGGTVLETN